MTPQCCSNIQGYFADSRSFTDVPIANDGFTWDPAVLDALLRTPSNSGGGGNGPATSMNFPAPPMPAPPHHSYPPPAPLTCMWGNCRAAFRSLSELVGHVNLQHLHPQPPAPPAAAAPADTRSCLWGDCDVFPSPASVPGPSSGDHEDSMRGVLASHLFQDHLGLPPVPQPQPQPQPLVTPSSSSARSVAPYRDASVYLILVSRSSPAASCPPTPVPEHDCSAPSAHVCRWRGCGHTFASCDALTAHITAAHVGAGKARYHCFWDGCTRNGESGFASKQKICRHMQVRAHLFCGVFWSGGAERSAEPYGAPAVPVRGVRAELLGGGDARAAHAAAHAGKCVSYPFTHSLVELCEHSS